MSTETIKTQFVGSLEDHSVLELLAELETKHLSGGLRLSNSAQKCVVYFAAGELVYAVSNEKQFRLFQVLLDQNAITKQDLAGIEEFTNDMYLAKMLVEKSIVDPEVLKYAISFQISEIVKNSMTWEKGEFDFNASARVKPEMHYQIDTSALIQSSLKSVSQLTKVSKMADLQEFYWLNTDVDIMNAAFDAESGFILSRLGSDRMSAETLASMCGMQRADILPMLYDLCLLGLLARSKHKGAIDKESGAHLAKSNFEVVRKAKSFEDELEKKKQEAAEEARIAEKEAEKLRRAQGDIPLEEYLDIVENAGTHYEMFELSPDAKEEAVKRAYLNFAKRFHPDRYQREVDAATFARVQDAFTEIAQAYETLRDSDAREVYDFKLKKAIEALRLEEKKEDLGISSDFGESSQKRMAKDNFERGYDFLLDENFDKALIHLARAVHIDDKVAKYHAYYGQALSVDGEKNKIAQQHLQKAVTLEPNNNKFRYMLAEILIKIGHSVRAKGELKKILSKEPNNSQARTLLDTLVE